MKQNLAVVSSDLEWEYRQEASMAVLAEFVGRLSVGDEQALKMLYEQTVSRVYALVESILSNASDSEEIVEDVYLYVWRGADTFNAEKGNVMAWLLTIARSRAIDRLRSRQRQNKVNEALMVQPRIDCEELDPLRVLDHTRARACLDALPEVQKQILMLVYFRGFTQTEIAEQLSMSLGTVKTHIRRTLIALREALAA